MNKKVLGVTYLLLYMNINGGTEEGRKRQHWVGWFWNEAQLIQTSTLEGNTEFSFHLPSQLAVSTVRAGTVSLLTHKL